MHIVVIAVAVVAFVLWMACSKAFKDETGVAPPTRKQWTAAKRRERARGLSDAETLDRLIQRKRKRG